MSYTVLARRYRSGAFGQVVGQEAIARTLSNAIERGRVAHAYLFTGTRGVGKTSMARLFARALNAPDSLPDAPHPPLADGQADPFPPKEVQERMAQAIMRGDDMNVIEIDGASNNSVDNARQLIANAGLAPSGNARYKIYIIDEVHMLSTAAFNALLKTMEEPPPHVKFVLCTTETHKVPATIQSRCQRFDFQNIPTGRIADHLSHVLEQETIQAEPQLIWQVARMANGSMRDGLSILERLIAAGGDSEQQLTVQAMEALFGLPPGQQIIALIDSLTNGDAGKSLTVAGQILKSGVSTDQILEALIEQLRQLLILKSCGVDSSLVELAEDLQQQLSDQAKQFDTASLVYMIALCENIQRATRFSSSPRAMFDALIVRLALAEKISDIAELLQEATDGEKKK